MYARDILSGLRCVQPQLCCKPIRYSKCMESPKFYDKQESKEKIEPVYTALFIKDLDSLTSQFPPRHENVFGHHSTIAFKPGSLDGIEVGAEQTIKVIGRVSDEKGDALLVENPKSTNEHPHITLSCAEGVKPFYSNELIQKAMAANSVEYFNPPVEIDVVEGYFDGKQDVIAPMTE